MNAVEEKVLAAVLPIAASFGYEVVAVEYGKQRESLSLTVFIHKPGGITLDDCERLHMAIDPVIDTLDPSEGKPFVLNVSSPGLDRPFKTHRDFERNYGEEVEVKLFAPFRGKKLYEGVLRAHDSNTVTIESAGETIKFELNKVALVRPSVKFE